ncbi:hypothetical protein KUCAC02_003636, partial [Chaenocephalus aceratus]
LQSLLTLLRRRGSPPEFAFTPTAALVSYVPKKGRNVVLLSTRHTGPPEISERADEKPRIVLDYNRNKGGVDNLDKVIGAYSCRRMTACWPLVVFHNILDVSCYNAFVVWRELNPGWMPGKRNKRRVFLERLGKALVAPFIERRKRLPRTSAAVVKAVRGGNGDAGTDSAHGLARLRAHGLRAHGLRAHGLPRARTPRARTPRDRKTHAVCCGCGRYVCNSGALAYCPADVRGKQTADSGGTPANPACSCREFCSGPNDQVFSWTIPVKQKRQILSQKCKEITGPKTVRVPFFFLASSSEKTPKPSEELILLQAGLGRSLHMYRRMLTIRRPTQMSLMMMSSFTTEDNDNQDNTFRYCGEIFAASVVQGGPPPHVLTHHTYHYLCHGQLDKDVVKAGTASVDMENLVTEVQDAEEDSLMALTDRIIACGYSGPIKADHKKDILEAIVLHSWLRLLPILQQLRDGLALYGLDELLVEQPLLCQQLFVPGSLQGVDADFLILALST